jgi:hypothetical protein
MNFFDGKESGGSSALFSNVDLNDCMTPENLETVSKASERRFVCHSRDKKSRSQSGGTKNYHHFEGDKRDES